MNHSLIRWKGYHSNCSSNFLLHPSACAKIQISNNPSCNSTYTIAPSYYEALQLGQLCHSQTKAACSICRSCTSIMLNLGSLMCKVTSIIGLQIILQHCLFCADYMIQKPK